MDSYHVRRGTTANPNAASIVATVTDNAFVDANVVPGQSYFYWVTAQNVVGSSTLVGSDSGVAGGSDTVVHAYEPFDYPVGSAPGGLNGSTGWAGPWTPVNLNGTVEVGGTGLSYGTLSVAGRSLRLEPTTDTPSILIRRQLANFYGRPGTVTWFSYIMNVRQRANGHLFVGPEGLSIGKRWGSQIAIDNTGSNAQVASGNQYFIVVRVDHFAGANDLYLWVDPALAQHPSATAPNLVVPNFSIGAFSEVVINCQGYGQGEYDVDELCLATSWAGIAGGAPPADTAAPTPNPSQWATVPALISNDEAALMVAVAATDPSGVEYYF